MIVAVGATGLLSGPGPVIRAAAVVGSQREAGLRGGVAALDPDPPIASIRPANIPSSALREQAAAAVSESVGNEPDRTGATRTATARGSRSRQTRRCRH